MHPGKDLAKVSLIFMEKDRRSVHLSHLFAACRLPPAAFVPSTNTTDAVHGRMNVTNLVSPHLDFVGSTLLAPMALAGIKDKWGYVVNSVLT